MARPEVVVKTASRPASKACHEPTAPALNDPDHAARIDKRLSRIEGQIRGVRRMVSEGRYCVEVLDQVQAIQQALRATSSLLLEAHLRSCVRDAFAQGGATRQEEVLKELADLLAAK